ncbi:MAG: alpha/beta fold hydrolase [Chloroflexota bacterium]
MRTGDLPPDHARMPDTLVVRVDTGDEIAWLDWGPPARDDLPALLLVHGVAQTGWTWAPVARRLAHRMRVLAPDLRGHGVSGGPRTGYDPASLGWDVLTVASACGYGSAVGGPPVVLAGHGAGAIVAAAAAGLAPSSVAGLVLVDGGWEGLADATGMSSAQYVAALEEPPEVLRSLDAFLADRRAFDPASWDADQERAARAQVVEKHAGHVRPATRSWALRAIAEGLFPWEPTDALPALDLPLCVLVAGSGSPDDDTERERGLALAEVLARRTAAGMPAAHVVRYPGAGHNLMRYRPGPMAAELLAFAERVAGERHAAGLEG